jgi:enoyl-CoA hydratase
VGFKTLIYEKAHGIASITLNRPKVLNAFNVQMRDDLYEVLSAIQDDDEIHVAVLKGNGEKAFCAGADLSEFMSGTPPVAARQVRFQRDLWGRFLSMPQPFIAVLHGYVLGSGIEMALCCDIRIAADDAKFGLPEVGLGIIPGAGGTQTLPRAVGSSWALEMLLTDRWIEAEEAFRIKLVNAVTTREELIEKAKSLAVKIASYDPYVVRLAKQAVMQGMDLPLSAGLELEKCLSKQLLRPSDER